MGPLNLLPSSAPESIDLGAYQFDDAEPEAAPTAQAQAPRNVSGPMDRKLVMYNQHTGEWLRETYMYAGTYQPEALRALSHFMRDWRTDQRHDIDPRLADLLYSLRAKLDTEAPVLLTCGYRSPKTNAMLRRKSRRVAKNSFHLQGMAADIRVEGVGAREIRKAAAALGMGGVGYYGRNSFVHVDVGPVRRWG